MGLLTVLPLVGFMVVAAPASADPVPEYSVEYTQFSDCGAALAAIGAAPTTPCGEATQSPLPPQGAAAEAEAATNSNLMGYCLQDPGTWYAYRFQMCRVQLGLIRVRSLQSGNILGEALFQVRFELQTESAVTNMAFRVTTSRLTAWGAGELVWHDSSVTCDQTCLLISSDPVGLTPPGITSSGNWYLQSKLYFRDSILDTAITGEVKFSIQNGMPLIGEGAVKETTPNIRCDSHGYYVGCVLPWAKPTLHYYRDGDVSDVARHIADAQSAGSPGAPGTLPLRRMANTVLVNYNRDVACPPNVPRPDGMNCDEYPFATTWQGAYTGQFIVPPSRGSARMVNDSQNSRAGAVLRWKLYEEQHVLPGDEFWVQIEPGTGPSSAIVLAAYNPNGGGGTGSGGGSQVGLPDGSTQMLGVGGDGVVYHNIRRANGTLQGWSAVRDNAGHPMHGVDTAITGMPDGSSHIEVIGADGVVYQNVRNVNGMWRGWAAELDALGNPMHARAVSTTRMPDGSTQMLAIGGDDKVYHNIRRANGTMQGWSAVTDASGNPMWARDVAITGTADGTARIDVVGGDGIIYHTVREANGSWRGWSAVPGASGPMHAKAVSTTRMPDGSTQMLAIGGDDKVYHNIRYANGTLQGWGTVTDSSGNPMWARDVAITGTADGTARIDVIGGDGIIYHTVREANGSWRDWSTTPDAAGSPMHANRISIT